jgi:hypothetical protein
MAKIKIHPSVTIDRITEAVERGQSSLDNPGICVLCGADADGCEPDARRYECESCGERGVYGAEELLMRLA